jgi:transketolase
MSLQFLFGCPNSFSINGKAGESFGVGSDIMTKDDLDILKNTALQVRRLVLDAIGHAGRGHLGGALSIVDALTVLYFRHMRVNPSRPRDPDRDFFICSKGHAGPALYAALALRGFFSKELLCTLNQGGTKLPSHCDMNKTPGVDMTAGALGHGLSIAVGVVLGNRLSGIDRNIYVMLGDGECQEGQVWEAAMSAGHFHLRELIGFIDNNGMQIDGYTRDIMNVEPFAEKWSAFGWRVDRVNGHDLEAIDEAITRAKGDEEKPSMIILDTVKGKGCSFAEGRVASHHMEVDCELVRNELEKMANHECT